MSMRRSFRRARGDGDAVERVLSRAPLDECIERADRSRPDPGSLSTHTSGAGLTNVRDVEEALASSSRSGAFAANADHTLKHAHCWPPADAATSAKILEELIANVKNRGCAYELP